MHGATEAIYTTTRINENYYDGSINHKSLCKTQIAHMATVGLTGTIAHTAAVCQKPNLLTLTVTSINQRIYCFTQACQQNVYSIV